MKIVTETTLESIFEEYGNKDMTKVPTASVVPTVDNLDMGEPVDTPLINKPMSFSGRT